MRPRPLPFLLLLLLPTAAFAVPSDPVIFSSATAKVKQAYLDGRTLGTVLSPKELAALDREAKGAPESDALRAYQKMRAVFPGAVGVQLGRGRQESHDAFLARMASVEEGLDLTPEEAYKAVQTYLSRSALTPAEVKVAAEQKLADPNLPPEMRASLIAKVGRIAGWLESQNRDAGDLVPGAGSALGGFQPGLGRSSLDLAALNSTPRAQSWVNSQMKKVPRPKLSQDEREKSVVLRTAGGKDTWYRPQPRDYFSDPKLSREVQRVWELAEKKEADPKYRNSTYGWLYDINTKRTRIAMAAQDIMMGYRYGGSEARYNTDFGTHLTPGQVADIDHFYAAAVYGAVPVLGPVTCAGASLAYDGIVSPAQKKFKNYAYDAKQVGTDMLGCSFGMTLAVRSGQ
ncbi:MAG TPA: hypothetical protein DD417_03430 [Elusimicrobia bacterium]|nr:hypothetical protein [Elusimicrobiota bacterium]